MKRSKTSHKDQRKQKKPKHSYPASSGSSANAKPPKKISQFGSLNSAFSLFSSSNPLLSANLIATSNPAKKVAGLYNSQQFILVVGDGNLSFSRALAASLGGRRITATVYDTEVQFREKYRLSIGNIKELTNLGATVRFGVDATKLSEQDWIPPDTKFDRIVFNFPNTDVADSDLRVSSNQQLLLDFFESAQKCIPLDGEIHVALRATEFYKEWKIVYQAQQRGLALQRTEPFEASQYAGYETCRTASADLTRQAPSIEGALVYIFKFPKAKQTQKQDSNNNNETESVDNQQKDEIKQNKQEPSKTSNNNAGKKKFKKKKKKVNNKTQQQ